MLILTVLTSIAIPIDRAMSYFRIITIIFSFLTLASLTGIVLFLTNQGFYPPVKQYDYTQQIWVDADPKLHPA